MKQSQIEVLHEMDQLHAARDQMSRVILSKKGLSNPGGLLAQGEFAALPYNKED